MRVVLQRVTKAEVEVDGAVVGAIDRGLVIFLGVSTVDTTRDADYLAEKVTNLRMFSDENGKMNRTIAQIGGAALIVSQFTLYGDCRKGRRPSFDEAAPSNQAIRLYDNFIERVAATGIRVSTGVFQAHMRVSLVNDGPVTFLLESKKFELP